MKIWKMGMLSLVAMVAACGQVNSDGEEITTRVGALGGSARFNFVKTADWGTGYNARIDITNIGSTTIQGWSADFDMPRNVQVAFSSIPVFQIFMAAISLLLTVRCNDRRTERSELKMFSDETSNER